MWQLHNHQEDEVLLHMDISYEYVYVYLIAYEYNDSRR